MNWAFITTFFWVPHEQQKAAIHTTSLKDGSGAAARRLSQCRLSRTLRAAARQALRLRILVARIPERAAGFRGFSYSGS